MNYEIILYNIQEAREQLEEIEQQLKNKDLSIGTILFYKCFLMRKHARSKCIFSPLLRAGFCIYKSILSTYLSEIDYQVKIEHAYHHLNFAWNIRHHSTTEYEKMSEQDFKQWGKFPKELESE